MYHTFQAVVILVVSFSSFYSSFVSLRYEKGILAGSTLDLLKSVFRSIEKTFYCKIILINHRTYESDD